MYDFTNTKTSIDVMSGDKFAYIVGSVINSQ